MNLFFMGVWNNEEKRGGNSAINMKMHEAEGRSVYCTWESGLLRHSPPHTPSSTPSLHQLAHWLPEIMKKWMWKMWRKLFHGKCLGTLCSDVWQNGRVHSWLWECDKHSRGVSSTWWRFIARRLEVIFTVSLALTRCQQNFSSPHLFVPGWKWV